ncbi:hydrolase [Nocardia sp. 852002-20019_SCH5090214]|jgi:cell wall-associated NlpC family hydrolase|uniref:NlpC/P60 family protein n=1 Tax=Nocardia nova TaxID=37330 RepID=A0A2S6A897_9NOCA|nr:MULTISPECIES: C40 family peptidase [Nocardia]OBF83071.1 hydrolase [Mycobacterium sp. 852002-51759_SCH5129042]MBF6274651.1 C40 family peptidase [Nocardia nova]MBV7705201.1 C40 family peptidase [Nocardia nova]OBA52453.1 hydrolase [Nocardia sp. 852002-51101_SCH5132738]OBA64550.1 hydrolase [Nocardia sp. 852002-20019_SCH5090214]
MAIKRQVQGLPRTARRAVAAGAVGAATLSALLLPATTAAAAPVTVPGVGTFDVPDQVLGAVPQGAVPPGIQIPGIAPAPFAPQQTVGQRAADAALSKVGAPYSYGAAGPNAFDCSGLVKWSYEQAGRELPRTSYEQLEEGAPVSLDALQPGDVVSFYGGSHSALYVGDGNVVHASTAGEPVKVAPISSMPVAGARRY